MQFKHATFIAALLAASALPAAAATMATATTPLNVRSGPGPQYSVIGAIPDRAQATIIGCIQGSMWCQVVYNGQQGWAYSQYLMATFSGRALALAEVRGIPPVTYQVPVEVVGSAVPAPVVAGTIVQPAATQPMVIAPSADVGTYVVSHPVPPAYLNGEVVIGAGLPEGVALAEVPGTNYDYAYVNSVPVLVEPSTRQVVYVYR